jgi:SAM-dependent methyltransferase
MSDWEGMWAAYDDDTYAAALSFVPPESVVLDIGAGDLRFARRLAARSRWVYAVERRPELLGGGAPDNMQVVCADARDWPFPSGLDVAVLLMRHCAHFDLYRRKLVAVGCRRLITNAPLGHGRRVHRSGDATPTVWGVGRWLVRLPLRSDRFLCRAAGSVDQHGAGNGG